MSTAESVIITSDEGPFGRSMGQGAELRTLAQLASGLLQMGAATAKTIASGAFALTSKVAHYVVDGEGAAADNLDSITGGAEGDLLVLRAASAARDITLRDASVSSASADGIYTPGEKSIALADAGDYALLQRGVTHWSVIGYRVKAADVGSARLKFFKSTEQTGTGSAQNIAHGLGVTPGLVVVIPTDLTPATVGSYVATEGTHDATNVVVTVTTSKKFRVLAFAP